MDQKPKKTYEELEKENEELKNRRYVCILQHRPVFNACAIESKYCYPPPYLF